MDKTAITKMDCETAQMAISHKMETEPPCSIMHDLFPQEISDKNRHPLNLQRLAYDQGIRQLNKLLAVQQNEIQVRPDDLPTSFANVETAIAQCIYECLGDSERKTHDIQHVLSLVRNSKVLLPVQGENPTVSLDKVHSILQDNFSDSYLCKLFNILIAGFMNTTPKVISFF